MTGEPPKQDWFSEFKKLTAPPPDAAGAPPTGKRERRRHPRFSMHDATIKLYRKGATAIFGLARLNIEGAVLDLSEGGLRLETGEQILIDTKVRMKITVVKFNDTFDADGVTRWCHADPKNEERFTVGVEFLNPDQGMLRKITQMRGWYTSTQYKALRDQSLREQKNKLM
jgi:PilZ domain